MEAAITALETMVKMAYNDPRAENPDFVGVRWGLDGLEAYATDVGDISRSGLPDEYFYQGWMGCHAIYPQISGRACVAVFLKRLGESETFQKEISMQILTAVGEYRAARAAWGEYERHLGNEETAEASNSWLIDEHRRADAAAIHRAIEHETAAVAEIKKGLTAIS